LKWRPQAVASGRAGLATKRRRFKGGAEVPAFEIREAGGYSMILRACEKCVLYQPRKLRTATCVPVLSIIWSLSI